MGSTGSKVAGGGVSGALVGAGIGAGIIGLSAKCAA